PPFRPSMVDPQSCLHMPESCISPVSENCLLSSASRNRLQGRDSGGLLCRSPGSQQNRNHSKYSSSADAGPADPPHRHIAESDMTQLSHDRTQSPHRYQSKSTPHRDRRYTPLQLLPSDKTQDLPAGGSQAAQNLENLCALTYIAAKTAGDHHVT